jgi:hypothetical protein
VISDSQDAVFMNPGSTVTMPVFLSREDTTMPSLPSVAGTTESGFSDPSTVSPTEGVCWVDVMSSFPDGPRLPSSGALRARDLMAT